MKARYLGGNIRELDPANAKVSRAYKFGPGGVHEIAAADAATFEALPEFELVKEQAPQKAETDHGK